MTEERTVACPICNRPYKFLPFYAGDQSACPGCVKKAEENTYPRKSRTFKNIKPLLKEAREDIDPE